MTMQVLAHTELTSSQSSITFSSIDQTGTDLLLVVSARSTRNETADPLRVWPNGSTSNLSSRALYGNPGGSPTVGSFTETSGRIGSVPGATTTSNTFGNVSVYIPNYSGSVAKSMSADSVTENNGSIAFAEIYAQLWNNTTAITSITLDLQISDFASGSSATLYKITKGSDGIVSVT